MGPKKMKKSIEKREAEEKGRGSWRGERAVAVAALRVAS